MHVDGTLVRLTGLVTSYYQKQQAIVAVLSLDDVEQVTLSAIQHMENNNGPALIYFENYRWLEHCGPNFDDDLGYRPQGELDYWMSRCPINTLEQKLLLQGTSEKELSDLKSGILESICLEFEKARAADYPSSDSLFHNLYPSRQHVE